MVLISDCFPSQPNVTYVSKRKPKNDQAPTEVQTWLNMYPRKSPKYKGLIEKQNTNNIELSRMHIAKVKHIFVFKIQERVDNLPHLLCDQSCNGASHAILAAPEKHYNGFSQHIRPTCVSLKIQEDVHYSQGKIIHNDKN